MPVIQGNTSGSIATVAYNIPCTIKSVFLTDKSGSSNNVGFKIIPNGGSPVFVWSGAISANETKIIDTEIKLLKGYQIVITASGSLDYYISI